MKRRGGIPTVLTIAGSDSSAGAGIEADLKTFAAHGVYGTSAITCVTAQDTHKIHRGHTVHPGALRAQIDAVLNDIGADAVKTGMLVNGEIVTVVANAMKAHRVRRLIVDPVLYSSNDRRTLLGRIGGEVLVKRLLPFAEVLTPNLEEAQLLANVAFVEDIASMEYAAGILVDRGARAVVVTGGHLKGEPIDVVVIGNDTHLLRGTRIRGETPHGTGCTFSAAIAAARARDVPILDAIRAAKRYTETCIRRAIRIGGGRPVLGHLKGIG